MSPLFIYTIGHLKVTTALERKEAFFAEVTILLLDTEETWVSSGSTSSPGPFRAHLPQYDKRPWGLGCTWASPGLSYHLPHKSDYFSNVIWTVEKLYRGHCSAWSWQSKGVSIAMFPPMLALQVLLKNLPLLLDW